MARRRSRLPNALVVVLAVSGASAVGAAWTTPARAQDTSAARDQFLRGAQLVKDADWAGALAAFEESARLRPHPVTTFNVGACFRAMGHYTRARAAFARALDDSGKVAGAELSPALTEETRRYVGELDRLLAVLELTIVPDQAQIAIDGRPLETPAPAPPTTPTPAGRAVTTVGTTLVAGTLPAGPGGSAPKGTFRVIVDPGAHVISISRTGFAEAVSNVTVTPGATLARRLELDRLPAQLRVTSNLTGAQVVIDEADVGLTPVEVNRPAGKYHVVVRKRGFLTFDTTTSADPGQSLAVNATLREDRPALTQRWWFWTGVGVLVVGAAFTTYALTRPEPERPAVDGGGLGWAARAP